MEMFNLKKLIDTEGKEKYHTEVSNMFAASKVWDTKVENNIAWEPISPVLKTETSSCRIHCADHATLSTHNTPN
jgi:hypothetical protein